MTSAVPTSPDSSSDPSVRPPVVLVADAMDPAGVEIMERAGVEVRVQTGLSPEELLAVVDDVDGILVRSSSTIGPDVFGRAGRLKAIGRAGIGVDNIDVAAASKHGVLVMNTPTANATTTAELAIAHMFGLARNLQTAQASMAAGRWDKKQLVGHEITGKTLCVVGLGKIGRIVAERGLGLKMNVIAHDPFLTGASPLPGVELVDLDAALERADFVSIHVPKSADTKGLFDAARLARMKPGAFLINCARGGIVDEAALVAALNDGTLAGAALDVFESEPLAEDSPLRAVPNLMLTPHLGASSEEAQQRVSTEIARQMADYLLVGEARCALNAPSMSAEELAVLRPWLGLCRAAGALLAQVAESPVVRLEINRRGELAERGGEGLRLAALAGVLSPSLDGPVNDVNADALAAERGLEVLKARGDKSKGFASLVELRVRTRDGVEHTAAGTLFRGEPRLVDFDGHSVDVEPRGTLLLTRHDDAPGVLGQVATFLGAAGVNIADLSMAAPNPGETEALAFFALDSRELTDEQLSALADLPTLRSARQLRV